MFEYRSHGWPKPFLWLKKTCSVDDPWRFESIDGPGLAANTAALAVSAIPAIVVFLYRRLAGRRSADRYAIGYSGIGYSTAGVRAVPLVEKDGEESVAATAGSGRRFRRESPSPSGASRASSMPPVS